MTVLLPVTTFLVAAALTLLEWRRPNRHRLIFRVLATLLSTVALGFLALRPADSKFSVSSSEAALWTAGVTQTQAPSTFALRFALPDALGTAPPATTLLPDAATLRRRFPAIHTLHVFGDGLDPAELPALGGLHLVFHPLNPPIASSPDIRFIHWPRELPLGDPLVVPGSVEGLPAGTSVHLMLEAPDGSKTDGVTAPADARGEAAFTLRAPPLPATGRFIWKLRLGQITEPIGVSVVPPALPRILVLEGEPHFDTAALRRWLGDAGGMLTVRTQIGKENFRFASTRQDTPAWTNVDANLLSSYDLLLADGRALATLHPEERAAVDAAVTQTGLGLLVLADDSVLPPDAPQIPPDLLPLLPWKLAPADDVPPNEERPVRPHWLGQDSASDIPVSVAPFVLQATAGQTRLLDDRRDHAIAGATHHGRGQIALTLVRDTTRWQRENDPAAFSAYWSFLVSRIARASDAATGRWSLVDGEAGPVFVDHPLSLRWVGRPDHSPGDAAITVGSDAANISLPLMQDLREPGWWQGTYWPRRAGWHRVVSTPAGATFDFYVHPTGDWPGLQASRRRLATERFADQSAIPVEKSAPLAGRAWKISAGGWFAVFVLATGYLWTERRFAANRLGSDG